MCPMNYFAAEVLAVVDDPRGKSNLYVFLNRANQMNRLILEGSKGVIDLAQCPSRANGHA